MTDSRDFIKQMMAEELGITIDQLETLAEVEFINSVSAVVLMDQALAIQQRGGVDGIDWCEYMGDMGAAANDSKPMPHISNNGYALFEASVLSMLNIMRMGMTRNGQDVPPAPPALLLPFELATA